MRGLVFGELESAQPQPRWTHVRALARPIEPARACYCACACCCSSNRPPACTRSLLAVPPRLRLGDSSPAGPPHFARRPSGSWAERAARSMEQHHQQQLAEAYHQQQQQQLPPPAQGGGGQPPPQLAALPSQAAPPPQQQLQQQQQQVQQQVQQQSQPFTNPHNVVLDAQGHTPAGVTAASLLPSRDQIPRYMPADFHSPIVSDLLSDSRTRARAFSSTTGLTSVRCARGRSTASNTKLGISALTRARSRMLALTPGTSFFLYTAQGAAQIDSGDAERARLSEKRSSAFLLQPNTGIHLPGLRPHALLLVHRTPARDASSARNRFACREKVPLTPIGVVDTTQVREALLAFGRVDPPCSYPHLGAWAQEDGGAAGGSGCSGGGWAQSRDGREEGQAGAEQAGQSDG